jgi:hypothetical protein
MIPSADLLHWLRELPSRRALHTLKQLAALLRKHRERTWDDRLAHSAHKLELAEDRGLAEQTAAHMEEILIYFASPESLRDVHLSREQGHDIKPETEAAVNAQLGALTMQLLLSARQAIVRFNWRIRSR